MIRTKFRLKSSRTGPALAVVALVLLTGVLIYQRQLSLHSRTTVHQNSSGPSGPNTPGLISTIPPDQTPPSAENPGAETPAAPEGNIFSAIESKNLDKVKMLLAANKELISSRNAREATVLQLAAISGQEEMARYLLSQGADVNAVCTSGKYLAGQSALHMAAGNGFAGVTKILLQHGAKVNAGDYTGATPLHEAAIQGRLTVIPVLLAHGANIDVRQHQGYTPLHWAASNGQTGAVKLLLAKGADVNAHAYDGVTPLTFSKNDATAAIIRAHGGKE